MNNIIFLDIDGVLNHLNLFKQTKDIKINYYKCFKDESYMYKLLFHLIDIDPNKLYLLKEIIQETNSKVVVTSSWRMLKIYPLIEDYLINKGIPIIDTTDYINSNRGDEIREYLKNHTVDNFIIIDDDVFPDFNELTENLIHTNFFNDGLRDEDVYEAIYRLKKLDKK